MNNGIAYKRVTNHNELYQILQLQQVNTITSTSKEERVTQGFVTVTHSFDVLKTMNDSCAHIIANSNNNVVGYALSMTRQFKDTIEVLKPMFKEINSCVKSNLNYIVMGQICIEKSYRGQGIFKGLYNFMRQELKLKFDAIITEVDIENTRSLNAHKAIGFNVLKSYSSHNQNWKLLIWHWK